MDQYRCQIYLPVIRLFKEHSGIIMGFFPFHNNLFFRRSIHIFFLELILTKSLTILFRGLASFSRHDFISLRETQVFLQKSTRSFHRLVIRCIPYLFFCSSFQRHIYNKSWYFFLIASETGFRNINKSGLSIFWQINGSTIRKLFFSFISSKK